MDGRTISASHKTVRTVPVFARIYEIAMAKDLEDRLDDLRRPASGPWH